ncbi:hypothetical protein DFH06DRAFT_1151343 [Mycena polygramma]|nr:hypothetical protein DFH06DRAFT_1151343 [Mycena polygramma]
MPLHKFPGAKPQWNRGGRDMRDIGLPREFVRERHIPLWHQWFHALKAVLSQFSFKYTPSFFGILRLEDTSSYRYSDSQTNITYETSDHSVCASLKNIRAFGYASLQTMETCPDGFTQLGLGPPAKTTGVDPNVDEAPFIVAADQAAIYYLMVCFPSTSAGDQILPKGKIYITNYTTGLPADSDTPLATDLFDDANPDCECPFLDQKF